MGVGNSQETRYELKGGLPAGMWSLRITPVSRGPTLHADVILRPASGGPEQIIFSADTNVGPGHPSGLIEGSIETSTPPLPAFPAACGDLLIVRVKLVAAPRPTHWHYRVITP